LFMSQMVNCFCNQSMLLKFRPMVSMFSDSIANQNPSVMMSLTMASHMTGLNKVPAFANTHSAINSSCSVTMSQWQFIT
ncbi:hypothetical protein D030_1552B, partial [Vibrio parahaemolyticus AQ3810]